MQQAFVVVEIYTYQTLNIYKYFSYHIKMFLCVLECFLYVQYNKRKKKEKYFNSSSK